MHRSIGIPVGDEVDAVGLDGGGGGGGGGGEAVEGAFGRVHGRMRAGGRGEEAAEAAEEEAHNETGEAPDSAGEINLGRIFGRRRRRVRKRRRTKRKKKKQRRRSGV